MGFPGQCLPWVHPADEVEPVAGRPGGISFRIPADLGEGGPQAGWRSALGVHHLSLQGLCLGLHLSKLPLSWLSPDQAKAQLAAVPHLQPEGRPGMQRSPQEDTGPLCRAVRYLPTTLHTKPALRLQP